MAHHVPRIALAVLLTACGDAPGDDTSDDTTSESETTAPLESAAVTYHRDIKPILDSKCSGCHSPGNIAPFALQTVDDAVLWAPSIAASVAAGAMPPWPPAADCNTYQHDRSLTDDQRRAIAEWAELGAPAGDPADAPPPAELPPAIDYDLQLALPLAYAPKVAPDEYRCFLLDWPEDQVKYVTGLKTTPGNPAIVHHVIAYVLPPDQLAEYEALDAADPDPGYLCYGGPGGENPQWLGSWVPGGASGASPEGTGVRIDPGSKIAVQVHYHTLPGAAPDRSTLALRTADVVDRPAHVLPFTNYAWPKGQASMSIPAGAAAVTHSFDLDLSKAIALLAPGSGLTSSDPLVIHAAGLHMHTLGVSAALTIERADGGQDCALQIPRWDFAWQGNYQLAQPLTLQPGDRLKIECTFDNSAGDHDIDWGEGTGDEMCLGMIYVTRP